MVYHGPRRSATNLQYGFYNQGGPEELSSQGVTGTGRDADGDDGTLPTLTCMGHRDHTGGGKPPPPTVPSVQYSGVLEGPERAARHHRSVCQWCGSEETAAVRRGDTGDCGEILSVIRQAHHDSHLFQIPGAVRDVDG